MNITNVKTFYESDIFKKHKYSYLPAQKKITWCPPSEIFANDSVPRSGRRNRKGDSEKEIGVEISSP